MFHRADARLRAWLTARANAGPRAPRQVAAEVERLGALLRAHEREHAAEEAAWRTTIEELQRAFETSERERARLLEELRTAHERLARAERNLAASETDREARLSYVHELEAALARERLEAARWRVVLPRVKILPPRRGALAARWRSLMGRIRR